MSSVDGRLLNERWTEPYDGTPATALLQVYAAIGHELNTDAWMFGKNTVCAVFPEKSSKGNTPFLPYFPINGASTDIPYRRIILRYSSANAIRNEYSLWPTLKPISILLPPF